LPLPNILGWQEIGTRPLVLGAALGGYSHVLLDSVMHADIRPLAPFSDGNVLLNVISLAALHWLCIGCALCGLVVIGSRKVFQS
jgi:membrane-bound metal-dependent hydrolase YbcI (DUF457 family)